MTKSWPVKMLLKETQDQEQGKWQHPVLAKTAKPSKLPGNNSSAVQRQQNQASHMEITVQQYKSKTKQATWK